MATVAALAGSLLSLQHPDSVLILSINAGLNRVNQYEGLLLLSQICHFGGTLQVTSLGVHLKNHVLIRRPF
jgi:hypothetical protein